MGNEALTRITIDGAAAEAKVLLETEEIIVRGGPRLRIPFSEIGKLTADDGVLRFHAGGRDIAIELGAQAAKWAEKIRKPKSVIDKIGVKPGHKVSFVGTTDEAFFDEVAGRSGDASRRLRRGSDLIFFGVSDRGGLSRLASLGQALAPAGALWVIRPKGTGAITDGDVIASARAAGLVDVKVVRFSATHSAEKLVIPLAKR